MQASLPRQSLNLAGQGLALVVAGVLIAAFAGLSFGPHSSIRLLLAALVAGCLLLLAVFHPRAAVLATLGYLAGMALIRRLLISVAGWDSFDPLLMVGPIVAAVLVLRIIFVSGARALAPDLMSALVLGVLLLTGLEACNPANGSLLGGVTGFLFAGVPLLWYLAGRNFGDRPGARLVVAGIVLVAGAESFYGLWQAHVGLPPWDTTWFLLNGYDALHVGEEALRPFGSFSSSAEYAALLAMAVTASCAYLLHGRPAALAALPLPLWALVEASIRAALALSVVGVIVMAALRARRTWLTLTVLTVGAGAVGGGLFVFGSVLEQLAAATGNALVVHTVAGLVHPYDPASSTLSDHQGLVAGGIAQSFLHPLGYGSAYLTGDKFLGPAVQTEVDFSNEFVALGPLGGLLYLALVATALTQAVRLYRRRRDPLLLAVVGILIADLGQWANGGFYAVAAIVWFLIGWMAREAHQPALAPVRDPSPTPLPRPPSPGFAGYSPDFAGERQSLR